jgi:hypothetical protein
MEGTTEQPHQIPEPAREHLWLKQFVGEWTFEGEGIEPGKPPQRSTGTENVRPLGNFWVIGEGTSIMPGLGEAETLLTIGFDPAKGRFVGSWVGSMMTNLWVYEGDLDEEDNTVNLYVDGPAFDGSAGTARYRDSYQLAGPDERLMTGSVQLSDGQWFQFLTARYTRRK